MSLSQAENCRVHEVLEKPEKIENISLTDRKSLFFIVHTTVTIFKNC